MSRRRKALPPPPAGVDPQTRQWMESVQEQLEVSQGVRGSSLDQFVAFGDILDIGLAQFRSAAKARFGANDLVPSNQAPNRAIPPRAEGVLGIAGIGFNTITFQIPLYGNHGYSEIWRAEGAGALLGSAVKIGISSGTVYADFTAAEGITYVYWVRLVSTSNIAGPFHASVGVQLETLVRADTVISDLEGQLSEIHLTSSLAGRIDLIDTPTTGILARLGVTEDDLYDPSTGIFALHQSLSDVVTDPVTGLPTRASQSDLTTLSGAVTDPITGLEARALQLHFESVASEIGVDPVTGAFAANGNAETWSQTATAVNNPTTGLSARAKQEDYITLASAIGVDPETGAFTALGSAESWGATTTAVSDPATGLAAKAGNTEFTNLQTWIGVDDSGTPTVGGKAQKLDQLYLELDSPAGGGSSFVMITQIADIQGTVDDLTAEWGVQIQSDTASGNVISGISLLAGPDGGSFQILADSFALWDPGPNYATNNADKDLVIGYFGGQLGIDGAYMRTATIDDAAIINLSVAKLTAGELTAGAWIKGGDFFGGQLRLGVGGAVRPDETGANTGYSFVVDSNGAIEMDGPYLRTAVIGERLEWNSALNRLSFFNSSNSEIVRIGSASSGFNADVNVLGDMRVDYIDSTEIGVWAPGYSGGAAIMNINLPNFNFVASPGISAYNFDRTVRINGSDVRTFSNTPGLPNDGNDVGVSRTLFYISQTLISPGTNVSGSNLVELTFLNSSRFREFWGTSTAFGNMPGTWKYIGHHAIYYNSTDDEAPAGIFLKIS